MVRTNFIPVNKMGKKQKKAYYSNQRVMNGFNTGTRTMKSAKYPNRQTRKKIPQDY